MAKFLKISNVLGQYIFWCQGCGCGHAVWVRPSTNPLNGGNWDFNGNTNKPTINPSILINDSENRICHSFINDGNIQYLNDCTHKLAGQTVELIDI